MIAYKKCLPALLVLASSTVFADGTVNQSGTINFQGEIYTATCTITINDINIEANPNPVVEMGRHPTSAFIGQDTEVGASKSSHDGKVTILAKECPPTMNLILTLNGTTENGTDNKVLKLTSDSVATNVGVVLYKHTADAGLLDNAIPINGKPINSKDYVNDGIHMDEGKTKSISFYPYYRKLDNTKVVTAGSADANLNYTLEYK
ncbi:fimbrial protein [Proteus alimentorum]|uniref:fimbrial protein n=1 Tax=Proteus alimentorum TaxID=1973495 RepID=UPI000C0006A0|nr:fimbrial protein [Proteus alimentorum]